LKMDLALGYESNPSLVLLIGIVKEHDLVPDLHPQYLQKMSGFISLQIRIRANELFRGNKKSVHTLFILL
jgi:hypothetical protein